MPTLGDRLKALREDLGLSQSEVNLRAGWEYNRTADLESGRTPDPRISTLLRVAVGLQLPVATIVEGLDEEYDRMAQHRPSDRGMSPPSPQDPPGMTATPGLTKLRKLVELIDNDEDAKAAFDAIWEALNARRHLQQSRNHSG